MKACKIAVIFLKDRNTPHELARSVLQFLKISCSLLTIDLVQSETGLAKIIIDNLFTLKMNLHVKKHKLLVRKILQRLIKRTSVAFVTKLMPEYHHAMITYLERMKRKADNKRKQAQMAYLMGEDGAEAPDDEDLSSDEEDMMDEGSDSEASDQE